MAKTLLNPIPKKAGRWSIQPHSKGNFIYSFNGHIPFDIISSYEHILLEPFHSSGQLCPSLGWTWLLAHSVPFTNNEGSVFKADKLQVEVRMLPRLKKVYFAMLPRWLKLVNTINSPYVTITFTISDPDGSIIGALMKGRSALFGKEVVIEKWIDKLPLIQCLRCYRLKHLRNLKACPFNKDSVKCHICGGAHKSDEHNQRCPCRHVVSGTCDCTTYKCLNCHRLGHYCHEERCPTQALFHLQNTRCVGKAPQMLRMTLSMSHPSPPTLPDPRSALHSTRSQMQPCYRQ